MDSSTNMEINIHRENYAIAIIFNFRIYFKQFNETDMQFMFNCATLIHAILKKQLVETAVLIPSSTEFKIISWWPSITSVFRRLSKSCTGEIAFAPNCKPAFIILAKQGKQPSPRFNGHFLDKPGLVVSSLRVLLPPIPAEILWEWNGIDFLRLNVTPVTKPTVSKHWRKEKALTPARKHHPLLHLFFSQHWILREAACSLYAGSLRPEPHTRKTTAENKRYLHFAWGIAEAKCIVVTDVCVSLCPSPPAFPHYRTDPDVTWGNGKGCPLVVHCWADLQSVHRFH